MHSLEVDTPVMNLIEHHSAQKRAPAGERAPLCAMVFCEIHDRGLQWCSMRFMTGCAFSCAQQWFSMRSLSGVSENHCAQERAPGARACVLWCSMRFVTGASTSKETIARARSAAGACSCAQCSRSMKFMTGVCISKEIIAQWFHRDARPGQYNLMDA